MQNTEHSSPSHLTHAEVCSTLLPVSTTPTTGFLTPTSAEVLDKQYLRSLDAEALADELLKRTFAARRALAVHIEVSVEDIERIMNTGGGAMDTFTMKNASDIRPGDVCQLDEDDVAEIETISQRDDRSFIAWCKGDKFPVYFDRDEQIPVRSNL